MKTLMNKANSDAAPETMANPLNNQNGSVIVLVLMVLAIMTVIGIVSSNTIVTENFIMRNVGIHKQNTSLAESALMVGLQEFMQLNNGNPNLFDPAASVWINDRNLTNAGDPEFLINTLWYEATFTQRCLNGLNSRNANTLPMLNWRGEDLNDNLRYAVVGWSPVAGMSVTVGGGGPTWRQGRIIAEYVSRDGGGNGNGFGLIRHELGVKQQW